MPAYLLYFAFAMAMVVAIAAQRLAEHPEDAVGFEIMMFGPENVIREKQ